MENEKVSSYVVFSPLIFFKITFLENYERYETQISE